MSKLFVTASKPNWAKVVDLGNGQRGWWSQLNNGEYVFLEAKTNRILIPEALRGKTLNDVKDSDFQALSPQEKGENQYSVWQRGFQKKQGCDKLVDDFGFTLMGKQQYQQFFNLIKSLGFFDLKQLGLKSTAISEDELNSLFLIQDGRVLREEIDSLVHQLYRAIFRLKALRPQFAENLERMLEPGLHTWECCCSGSLDEIKEQIEGHAKRKEHFQGIFEKVKKLEEIVHGHALDNFQDLYRTLDELKVAVRTRKIKSAQSAFEQLSKILLYVSQIVPNQEMGMVAHELLASPVMTDIHDGLFNKEETIS